MQVGARLVVLNLSQQTDSSDFVGGFRPVDARSALNPLLNTFRVCPAGCINGSICCGQMLENCILLPVTGLHGAVETALCSVQSMIEPA